MENQEIWYEYQGNRFRIEIRYGWNSKWSAGTIRGITLENSRLCLPDSCQGHPVTGLKLQEKNPIPTAKYLYLPASVTELEIGNALFPGLEEIEVQAGHSKFSTNGQMLLSADGRELLYIFAAGNRERAVVPKEIRKIAHYAFSDTTCNEILFENPDVSVERDAFLNSEWMRRQGDCCIVGNLFFRLSCPLEKLVIPDGIRRIHESAFRSAAPKHLDTPVMPSRNNIEDLGGRHSYYGGDKCGELTLRSRQARLSFGSLRGWHRLQAVHVPEGHKQYCSVDGIVFSRDRKTLVFYPPGKQQDGYDIPDGVAKIGRSAFEGQAYLKEVRMPDSVTTLGMSAFFQCAALRKVVFSESLREIPDASAYQEGGVFEDCEALEEAALPRKLQYLGSYAFCGSGLRRITLGEGLRQMGEYALAAEHLREVALPQSLERLGKGALYHAQAVTAYLGTAKGLVAAVNAAPSGYMDKSSNVKWGRCVVTALRRRGNREETFLIPGSLKLSAASHLDMAWNGDEIDYEEYDACFEAIQEPEERLEFAEQGILRLGEEDSPYTAYLRHSAMRIASHLVEQRREAEFLAFLRRGYLSEQALSRLLKMTNQNQMTTCSAYILKHQEAQGSRKKRTFAL